MIILIYADRNDKGNPFLGFTKVHERLVREMFPKATVIVTRDPKVIEKNLAKAEIFFTATANLDNLANASSLKWLHVTSAGVDRLPESLIQSDVIVTNSSGVHPIPISEHVLGFMVMFARRLHLSYRDQILEKSWHRDFDPSSIYELSGKTVGIAGLGRIGQRVAKVCKALDMHVVALVHDPKKRQENVDQLFANKDIKKFLQTLDFVVNCLPLTDETKHLFNKEKFAQMKSTSYFINIGRGKTVKESDLVRALKQKQIAGAGLDVFEEEPLPKSSPLWQLDNVIITPHYSGWTPFYMDRVVEIFLANAKAYLAKKPMPNAIDKSKGY